MADPYPSVPQKEETQPQATFGTRVDRAESGRPRIRTFYSQQWLSFTVRHECDKAQMQSIIDHYLAWYDSVFTFTFAGDGVNYNVRYADIPATSVVDGDYLWRVESQLIVV